MNITTTEQTQTSNGIADHTTHLSCEDKHDFNHGTIKLAKNSKSVEVSPKNHEKRLKHIDSYVLLLSDKQLQSLC